MSLYIYEHILHTHIFIYIYITHKHTHTHTYIYITKQDIKNIVIYISVFSNLALTSIYKIYQMPIFSIVKNIK